MFYQEANKLREKTSAFSSPSSLFTLWQQLHSPIFIDPILSTRKTLTTNILLRPIAKLVPYTFVKVIFLLLQLIILTGCSQRTVYAPVTSYNNHLTITNRHYRVREGETLYSIGFRSGHGYQKLAKWNRIPPPYKIEAGQKLKLFPPAKTRLIFKQNVKTPGLALKKRTSSQKKTIVSRGNKKLLKLHWQWPIRGNVSKTFSQTGKKGIDISGKTGQRVSAAATGKVVYSGDGLIGYGNLLIIKHNYLYLSAYANNRRLLVKEGQMVKKGQTIAEVGRGNGSKPVLHFEIRKNGNPVNPVLFLPKM